MQFFKQTNINFVGMRKITYLISSLLVLASIALYIIYWTRQGSPFNLGIEFSGGTALQIKFNRPISLDEIRALMTEIGFANSMIQNFGNQTDEILIRLKQYEGGQNEIEDKIKEALTQKYGEKPDEAKEDLNSFKDYKSLLDLVLQFSEFKDISNDYMAQMTLQQEIKSIIDFKENNGGIIRNFDELRKIPGLRAEIVDILKTHFYLSPFVIRNITMIGPAVGKDLRNNALKAIFFAIIAILIYISWRFDFKFAVAAVIALIHDVSITSGVFVLTQREVTLSVIAALLTIFGYSLNDTIVVSDRIRENYRKFHKESFEVIVNRSINETLSRTIITSLTTLLTVLALFFFGGEVIHNFSLALLVGIIVGTYSSIFVVSPIVLDWHLRSIRAHKR